MINLVFCVRAWVLLPLLLQQAAAADLLPSTLVQGFHWVLTPPLSSYSHTSACRFNGLYPTSTTQTIPWGLEVMQEVVTGLGRQLINTTHGLAGCCAPGLWCLPEEEGGCYTQSLQDQFVNVELSAMANRSSVYTCVDLALNEVVTGFLSYEYTDADAQGTDGKVVVSGSGYGLDRDVVAVTLNGESCADVDLCHSVCQSCTTSPSSCPTGSICLGMTGSPMGCYLYCAGPEDTSCPCSTSCVLVSIQVSQTGYLPTHLCAPEHFSCSSYSPVSGTDSHLQCHTPSVYSQLYLEEGDEWLNDEQEATISVQHDAVVLAPTALSPLRCTADADCFDLDAYTSDTCSEQGVCIYSKRENFTVNSDPAVSEEMAIASSRSSTLSHVRDRTTPFTYVWFQLSEQETAQASFESDVNRYGTSSSVSLVDDFPVDFFNLDFTFEYFGNMVTEVSVNPNGVLSFPPFSHCWGMISNLGCPVHRTSTNIISLWGRDWDPSNDATASVLTLQQRRVDGEDSFNVSSIGGVNANAFHVLYSAVRKYDAGPDDQPNTFSASLFEDGSVRLRYHDTNLALEASDVFGLWGSRASTPLSPLLAYGSSSTRYYQEKHFNASALVDEGGNGGQDVVFCSLTTMACMPDTCTSAGGSASFLLLGAEPSCLAAGGALQVWCVWAGGLAVTLPSFSPSPDSNHTLVQCPTPLLGITNNSLISLDLRLAVNQSAASSPMSAGQKSIFTKNFDSATGEVVNSHLMVRYFSALEAAMAEEGCGCDAMSTSSLKSQCNSCLVCGTAASTEEAEAGMRDCHGDCFGAAYVDTCGSCAGGGTGVKPISSCDFPDDVDGEEDINSFSKTILFIVLMICMTFMFTACLRIIRTSVSMQEQEREALERGGREGLEQLHAQRPAPLRRGNGLSRFEIDALGEDTFGLIKSGGVGGTGEGINDMESGVASSLYGARHSAANLECAICLNDFVETSQCRQLPCEHVFHKNCIDEWFVLSVKCPMCKRNIRDIFLGEEALPPRRPPPVSAGPSGSGEGGAVTTRSGSSIEHSDDGSDGGVENPLIVEMTSRSILY